MCLGVRIHGKEGQKLSLDSEERKECCRNISVAEETEVSRGAEQLKRSCEEIT